jgi:NAD-dependent deacetylase
MIEELAKIIRQSSSGAVLTGAGISAESGVPTFRGKEGLWGKFRAEELATMDAFLANPTIVWQWYNWRRELIANVKPNPGHLALVQLERYFERFTIITQNVDNLHRLAGSAEILELHGNIYRNKCVQCNLLVDDEVAIDPDNIACCGECGGRIRPDVVWFGEMLPVEVVNKAFEQAERCEVFFSIGTSALVHPAASLPMVAKRAGATLVEINPDETPVSPMADYRFAEPSGVFLPRMIRVLENSVSTG